jgi:hypothetical protein
MRSYFLCDIATGADGNGNDNQIGTFHRGGIAFDNLVGKAEFGDTLAGLRGPRGGYDRARRTLRTRSARNRGPNEPDAD